MRWRSTLLVGCAVTAVVSVSAYVIISDDLMDHYNDGYAVGTTVSATPPRDDDGWWKSRYALCDESVLDRYANSSGDVVSVLQDNRDAQAFWNGCVTGFMGGERVSAGELERGLED
jgi:hypothetical protein